MPEIAITLGGLLKVISTTKSVTINLYKEVEDEETHEIEKVLLITFLLPGYDCLDDFLIDDEVTKFEVVNSQTFNITIDTSLND